MKPIVEFDAAKDVANRREHGISLESATHFDFATVLEQQDNRRDYGEIRMIAIGYIEARLHVLIYTRRDGNLRPISLRKANPRERKRYEETI